MSPFPHPQKANFQKLLPEGELTRAYAIWNVAAEGHLALQLKNLKLPTKCSGRGKVPTFQNTAICRHMHLPCRRMSRHRMEATTK